MKKELGKITRAEFGMGGYQDAMLGFTFTLSGKGWAVGDFKGWWAGNPSKSAKWTRENQRALWGENCEFVRDLLGAAKVNTLNDLIGIPIEVSFDANNTLNSWRLLKEAR